ncbi:DsbA family protein [Nitrosopumilus sp.]|uniref:DsbA family protein n=1 Tax=Nitrosopumilus sp. TaxID=2024843 RepID=UPI003D09AFA8
MTKRNKKSKSSDNPKTKFVVMGIIGAIVIGIVSFGIISPDSFIVGNSSDSHLSLDPNASYPILGSPSAPVTIVEFGDYQCPFCQKWNMQTKPSIVKNFIETGKAKLIFIDYTIIGPDSIKAHAGSYCAGDQGKYWEYHDYLYSKQGHENNGWVNSENLKLLVRDMDGIDIESFSQCLDSGKYEEKVRNNKNIATKAGVDSTPSFVIVGPSEEAIPITGAQPYTVFERTIEELLT